MHWTASSLHGQSDFFKYTKLNNKLCQHIVNTWKDQNMLSASIKMAKAYLGDTGLDIIQVHEELDFVFEETIRIKTK